MSIENLRNALPSYAKDMNLNLSSLPRITSLTEQQLWGAILATAAATKVDSVIVEIAAEAKEHLSDTAFDAALGAATIMGMNNIFYRTRGFLDGAYDDQRANLRMQIIGKPDPARREAHDRHSEPSRTDAVPRARPPDSRPSAAARGRQDTVPPRRFP